MTELHPTLMMMRTRRRRWGGGGGGGYNVMGNSCGKSSNKTKLEEMTYIVTMFI
jgi:hypothetical protein